MVCSTDSSSTPALSLHPPALPITSERALLIAQFYEEPSTESRSAATKRPIWLPPSAPFLLKEHCQRVTHRPFSSEPVAPPTQKNKSKAQIHLFPFLSFIFLNNIFKIFHGKYYFCTRYNNSIFYLRITTRVAKMMA